MKKKKTRSADFCADQIDVITNVAVIMNIVIKRVHYIARLKIDTLVINRKITAETIITYNII